MATNKLGTLVYDLIADTKGFQKGIVSSRKEVTALKKVFLESRTPVEAFGIQMQGMQKLIESGARPVNMFSRSIADLAVKTKGGGREARAFVESLRQQASQIVQSVGHYRVLSKEDRERVDRLRAVARAIEREVDMQRNAIAEKLRAKRASDQEARSARRLSDELKKLEAERNKQSAAVKRQADAQAALLSKQKREAQAIRDRLDPRRALARQMTGVRALGAAGMLSPEEVAAEQKRIMQSMRQLNPVYQEQQRRLAGVRAGLQSLITPMQKNRQATRDLITEFKAGNVGSKQFDARLKQLREEHKRLYEEQKKGNVQQNAFVKGMALQTTALLRQISAISAMYAAIRQIRGGIADALEIGRSQRQFQTFTGSAEVAAGLMNQIRGLAAETPITLGAAQQGVTTLLQYGVSQSEVMGTLRQLGDVSGGSTEALQRLSLAFGQITANTRLQGQELRQLVEAGFNPLMFISEKTGESMFDLRQRMADGDISINEVRESLRDATSGAGRFANALENIATETAFGKIERLKSELLRFRADLADPAAQYFGNLAGELVDSLGDAREKIRQQVLLDPSGEIDATQLFPQLYKEMTSLNPFTRIYSTIKYQSAQTMVDAIRDSIKSSQAEVDRELPKLLDSLYRPMAEDGKEAVQDLNDEIHERIALLKKQRAEVLLGKDEAELAALVQQGVSREYIDALRKEMQLLEDARKQQNELEEAEKQRHEAAMKRQRDREQAAEKEQRDRAKQIEDDRRAAEALAKSIRTPLEVLEAEMTDIQKVAEFLTVDQRVKLMEQARERFDKAMQEDTKDQTSAAAATRGSVEEFRLLSEINKQQVDREQKNHNEAMGARDQTNRLLNLNISGLNILPVKLGAALSELMGTPVRASGVPTFSFLPPSSFDRR
jgi:tape measure domain-containing protein